MAVQGSIRRHSPVRVPVLLWAATILAASLTLTAVLGGLLLGKTATTTPASSAADEAVARDERIAFFEARAASDPLDTLSLNVLAGEYLQRGRETGDVKNYQQAEAASERSLEVLPTNNFAGLVLLGSVRLVQHNYNEAADLANQALVMKPADPASYSLLSDAQVGVGDYAGASKTLDKLRDLDSGLPTLSREANLAFLTGDRINTMEYWKGAIQAGAGLPLENQAWAHVQLGITDFAFGDYKAAVQEQETALRLYPNYVHALAGLGQAKAAQGDYEGAIAAYEQAVAIQPQPQYVAALGDVYAAAGRQQDAEDQYALVDAIAALFRDAGINTDLQIANFYTDHDRNLPEALTMAQAAYAAAPNVYAADALAWARYKNGQLQAADEAAQQAIAGGAFEARFYYHAAVIRHALGDDASARDLLTKAMDLNPQFSPLYAGDASALLATLEAK